MIIIKVTLLQLQFVELSLVCLWEQDLHLDKIILETVLTYQICSSYCNCKNLNIVYYNNL